MEIKIYNNFNKAYHMRTVCEVTREVYDILEANKEQLGELYLEIFAKLNEMMIMQKKMDAKLKEYKSSYESEMYSENPNWQEKDNKRKEVLYQTLR